MLSLEQIEIELKQRVSQYPPTAWGKKQDDDWDKQTAFIYRVSSWEQLAQKIAPLDQPLANYAVNRWFDFWSAMAIENVFAACEGVQPNPDRHDRLKDFSIQGIHFDHKTSVFPRGYSHSLDYAREHKAHLIQWLYRNQSHEQRYHESNRLFIILYARDGAHWKLRAEIGELATVMRDYVAHFSPAQLVRLPMGSQSVLSDIVWFVK